MFDKKTFYAIDSNMGGVFKLKFQGETETAYKFRIVNPGWQRNIEIPKTAANTVKIYT